MVLLNFLVGPRWRTRHVKLVEDDHREGSELEVQEPADGPVSRAGAPVGLTCMDAARTQPALLRSPARKGHSEDAEAGTTTSHVPPSLPPESHPAARASHGRWVKGHRAVTSHEAGSGARPTWALVPRSSCMTGTVPLASVGLSFPSCKAGMIIIVSSSRR